MPSSELGPSTSATPTMAVSGDSWVMRPRAASLSVLIVNYHSTQHLRTCLDALLASTMSDELEIIVVDNASLDFDKADISSAYPRITLLPQPFNATWTGGNNIAFAASTGEYVLLLNPDARVEPDALEAAVGHLQSSPGLVAVGALLTGPDGKVQRYYRRLPTMSDVPVILFEPLFRRTARGRRYLMLNEDFSAPLHVPQPPGAFLLVRRSAAPSPLVDPAYANFVSDVELCRRLSEMGQIMVFPDVRVTHQRAGAGVGTADPRLRARLYRDLAWGLRHYFRRSPGSHQMWLSVLIWTYCVSRFAKLAVKHPARIPGVACELLAAAAARRPRY